MSNISPSYSKSGEALIAVAIPDTIKPDSMENVLIQMHKLIETILNDMPILNEWHNKNILQLFNKVTWNDSIRKIHSDDFESLKNSFYLKRLIFERPEYRRESGQIKKYHELLHKRSIK